MTLVENGLANFKTKIRTDETNMMLLVRRFLLRKAADEVRA